MSGLQKPLETEVAGVDVQERGNSLRVATNTPHLVSLGCGRLSTAVTIHPIKQGRVTIGSDPSSDIRIQGTGVQPSHCHIENSHGVVTLYPQAGDTTVDGALVDKPVRLSQGCMIGIGRSNYLRFNHPAEANLMKSVLPNPRISMAPIHFLPNDSYQPNQMERTQADHHAKTNGELNYDRYGENQNDPNLFMDGHKNLEKELDMTYKELSKRKPPTVPRKTYRELDQISNSSNSDQEVAANAPSEPRSGGIMAKVSKFEYYVRNSQKNVKNSTSGSEVWSPKVFSSNSLTVNTPAKDVLVNREVPTNFAAVNKNQQRVDGNNLNNASEQRGQRKIVLNENNAVEAKNCSYTNVVVKNQVIKIDQMAKSYQGVLSKTQNADRNRSVSPEMHRIPQHHSDRARSSEDGRPKLQAPSASFNRNPVFGGPNGTISLVSSVGCTSGNETEAQWQQAHQHRMEDENQKYLEEARLEEILNMCAEYEKQISLGVPTTPTEKKQHNKIITNGSLPRGIHNTPNIVQTSDGYFRFDTGHHRTDFSPHHQPPSPQSPLNSTSARSPIVSPRLQLNSKNLSNYENVQPFQQNGQAATPQYSSHHSSYENFNLDTQSAILQRQEHQLVQNVRQFPITELSSPVMIRKIARNAQNASNYIGSYERNLVNSPEHLSPPNFVHDPMRPHNFISPYENVSMKNNMLTIGNVPYVNSMAKSPSSHSPRTRIKTTYAHKNLVSPQHFVFPSPPQTDVSKTESEINRCQGIEKQLSLTEDIPMIDDTEFANELEMRIARLKPENRITQETDEKDILLDPDNVFDGQRRNFEEIKRDLIADIPELDEIHRHIDRDLSRSDEGQSESVNTALKKISEDMKEEQLVDEVFEESTTENKQLFIESPQYTGEVDILADSERKSNEQRGNSSFVGNEASAATDNKIETVVQIEHVSNDEEVVKNDPDTENLKRDQAERMSEEFLKREKERLMKDNRVIDECVSVKRESDSQIVNDIRRFMEQESAERDRGQYAEDNVSSQLETLRCKRKEVLTEIHKVKCKMADIRSQEDDILRELEMEKALLRGEYDSEIAILHLEQGRLVGLRDKAAGAEEGARKRHKQQEERQAAQGEKVKEAAIAVERLEREFTRHEATLEELRNGQESLDNEKKTFEDMEFQDLEEEADWLAYREELQNEITALTQKIDAQKSRILNLRFETSNNLNAAVEETKSLQAEYVKLLNKIEGLTNTLQSIELDIKAAVSDVGTDYVNRNSSIEDRRSRIKSGDFSPPSSDNEDTNNIERFENRKKDLNQRLVSIDQMSRSMIVDLGDKRSIDDLVDRDRSLQSTECSPNKFIDSTTSNESSPTRNDLSDASPDKEKKQGFWERNFDSLSRLKSKDKKSKQKSQDIMSQSLNENMFFDNENIESDFGSFEKCNSLRGSKRSKAKGGDLNCDKSSSSKLSFSSLGRIIKKDSIKKPKEERTGNRSSVEIVHNKENIDVNVESTDEQELKNVKHRYVKNTKVSGNSDNKYLNKCTKTTQQPISIPPMDIVEQDSNRLSNCSQGDNRESFADSLEEEVRIIDPLFGNTIQLCHVTKTSENPAKMFRKSAGDEMRRFSGEFVTSLTEKTKVPSQDDIDRISKVTLDAPLLSKNGDMNSLGRRTLDSLREVERNRVAMLEQKGCQVIEDEREKISELKKRVQNEAKQQWEESQQQILRDAKALTQESAQEQDNTNNDTENSSFLEDPVLESYSPEKQLRHSQTDSFNSSAFIEDEDVGLGGPSGGGDKNAQLRPLSQVSDMSSENGGLSYNVVEAPRRSRKVPLSPRIREDLQRPLTRYLPIDQDDLNLRAHIESAGHQVDLCPHVIVDSTSCRGYLHKLGAKFHGWSKRWFVFDRASKTLIYYSDKSERKPRGGAYFQVIEEVYLDHLNVSKSPTPLTTFVIKTRQRRYYLMAPSGQAARIWIDVVFTGAQGYTEYMQ